MLKACLCEGLHNRMLMRCLPVHAIYSLPPPLHANLCQGLLPDVLAHQAGLNIECPERKDCST